MPAKGKNMGSNIPQIAKLFTDNIDKIVSYYEKNEAGIEVLVLSLELYTDVSEDELKNLTLLDKVEVRKYIFNLKGSEHHISVELQECHLTKSTYGYDWQLQQTPFIKGLNPGLGEDFTLLQEVFSAFDAKRLGDFERIMDLIEDKKLTCDRPFNKIKDKYEEIMSKQNKSSSAYDAQFLNEMDFDDEVEN